MKILNKKKTLNPEFNEKMCLLVDPTDLTGRLLFEVYDWDAMTDDDLIGGFSISITELLYNPANGWFRKGVIWNNIQHSVRWLQTKIIL